jgi:hypothetical protein
MYLQFSFYNIELQEWVNFIDAGSEQIKPGMKKRASRIGVASIFTKK